MIKRRNISQDDISAWENYTKNPTDVIDKDDIQTNKQLNLQRFRYDLHGFTLTEANKKVREIILSCSKKNF